MWQKPNIEVLKVVGIYTVLAALWILFSDRVLGLFIASPDEQMILLQSIKGMGFVLTTAALLYLLILRMERHLLEAHHALQLDAQVLAHTREGVIVTDAENRIIMVNRGFERITGYRAEQVLGKNPSLLRSDHQNADTYQDMWVFLQTNDYWQGEILNRRRSGELYPGRLSISTIRDEQGRVHRHIGILTDITREKRAREHIDFLAHYDPLTRLPNRARLEQHIEESVETAARTGGTFTILTLDLDRFKLLNEGLGYEVGNSLLQEITRRLQGLIRETEVVSRQSGDEFTLLLHDRDLHQVSHFAEQVLAEVSRSFHTSDNEVSFTCSIGLARYPDDGNDAGQLLQAAASALSRTKNEGRNEYRFYDTDTQARSLEYLQLEHGLRHAADNGELLLYFQPQYHSHNGSITGVEALIRWQHPTLGLIGPGRFIPIAEESGQIIRIGTWVLQRAVWQIHEWQSAGLQPVPVAINLSVAHFRFSKLIGDIRSALASYQVDPQLLCLEITESVAMADAEYTLATIRTLQELGVGLAIDDFGSGYSSFNYLRQLNAQKLKIDQGFIRDLSHDRRSRAIVQSIITLAHSLEFSTTAEGVETAEQLELLRSMGCDEIQGFFFARPMPASDFQSLLPASASRAGADITPRQE